MKHVIIIGLLLAASVVAYLSLNKTDVADAIRTAISKVAPGHTPPPEKGVAALGAKPALPALTQTVVTNETLDTNRLVVAPVTNSWERATAGKYADLIQEIRNARGNAQ